jgi:hypothetical protein
MTFDPKYKEGQDYFPCRVCNCKHENPMSRSICHDCGLANHLQRVAEAAAQETERLNKLTPKERCIARIRSECNTSMAAAKSVVKAFAICMEELNNN